MRHRGFGWLVGWMALAGMVSGCGTGSPSGPTGAPSTSGDTLSRVLRSGELHVGYLVFNPCVNKDPSTGKLSGTFIDAVEAIAVQLKVKPVYHETTLGNFVAGLESGQFDLSIGPTYRTIPRASTVAFCRPLNYVGNSAVVRKDRKGEFRKDRKDEFGTDVIDTTRPGAVRKGREGKFDTIAKIVAAKAKVAVLQGQAMEEYFRRRHPQLEVLSLSGGDLTAPLSAVSAGQADVGFMNTVTVKGYAAEHPEVEVVLGGEDQVELLALGWSVRYGDFRWWHFINTSLDYLVSTGRWDEFQGRYPIHLLQEVPTLRYPVVRPGGAAATSGSDSPAIKGP